MNNTTVNNENRFFLVAFVVAIAIILIGNVVNYNIMTGHAEEVRIENQESFEKLEETCDETWDVLADCMMRMYIDQNLVKSN